MLHAADPDIPNSDFADDDTVIELLHQLNPEINRYINLECLLPYLNRHGILNKTERFHFNMNMTSKSQNERVTYLLQVLDSKDGGTVLKFVQALKEEPDHTGHKKLCSLLAQRRAMLS